MDNKKTKVIWRENQNDIHTDFGLMKSSRKVKNMMITVRNYEESVDLMKVTYASQLSGGNCRKMKWKHRMQSQWPQVELHIFHRGIIGLE
jgi:hypothetical protein